MKNFLLLLLALSLVSPLYSQRGIEINNTGQLKLLGHVKNDRLSQAPFAEWFQPNYDTFQIDNRASRLLKKSLEKVDSIQVFFGTWCGDSKREVPKFMKLMDEVGYENINLIGLDHTFQNYKQSPYGEERGLNVHRVPTFIVYQGSSEIGRIVEYPVASLSTDLMQIANREEYTPNYNIVETLITLFEDKGVNYVKTHIDSITTLLKPVSVKISELNTYAFRLFTSFEIQKSEIVYDMNTRLFPDDPYPFLRKGRFYQSIGNDNLAKLSYVEGLLIDSENEKIRDQLATLN